MHGQMKLSVDNRQDYPCETFLKEVILKICDYHISLLWIYNFFYGYSRKQALNKAYNAYYFWLKI